MGKPISHQLDVYGAWIHLARDRAEWRALKKRTGLKLQRVESLGLTMRFHESDGGIHLPVFIDVDALEGAGLVEIIAHEAAHLSGMLLDTCGASYDGESEPFAYLVGFIAAWLWSGCQKR
jgi:hypothetical protein